MTISSEDLHDIRNFQVIGERISTSGMPSLEQFSLIANAGYQVVINLAAPEPEHVHLNEDEIVSTLGIGYIWIPVIWAAPQQEDLRLFFQAMDDHKQERVFVHCVANYRASVFAALYRILRLEESPDLAMADLKRIWNPEGVWVKFIQDALSAS